MAVNTPLKTDEIKPKYEVIEYEGKPARLYPDGAIRNEKGHFLAQHPDGRDMQISPSNAREFQARRWQAAQERTASRIMREAMAIDPDVRDEYDAHALMYAMQYTKLADADKPNVDDAEKIAQAMGTMPRAADLRQPQQAGTQSVAQAIGNMVLESVWRDVMAAKIVDTDVIDDDFDNTQLSKG